MPTWKVVQRKMDRPINRWRKFSFSLPLAMSQGTTEFFAPSATMRGSWTVAMSPLRVGFVTGFVSKRERSAQPEALGSKEGWSSRTIEHRSGGDEKIADEDCGLPKRQWAYRHPAQGAGQRKPQHNRQKRGEVRR